MGKKDKDKKKKGKGAEKTAEKTEKKAKLKAKKELAAKGEDDIESIVKSIEEEEKKRQEVKEVKIDPPSHRSCFSMTIHPDNPEIVFFGGEFYNGQTTKMFNDLIIFNIKVIKESLTSINVINYDCFLCRDLNGARLFPPEVRLPAPPTRPA